MGSVDTAVVFTIAILGTAACLGLVHRRRLRACVSFAGYLGVSAVGGLLVGLWPSVFWSWRFWVAVSALQATLRAGMAVEIAFKTFRPPLYVGRRRARLLMTLIALGTALSVASYSRAPRTALDWTLLVESLSYGIAALFTAFLLLVRYYRVPIDPLHRDIAAGSTLLSLLVYYSDTLYRIDPWFGLGTVAGRDLITKTLYPLLLVFWNVSAWRRDAPPAFTPEVERVLQPWRTRR